MVVDPTAQSTSPSAHAAAAAPVTERTTCPTDRTMAAAPPARPHLTLLPGTHTRTHETGTWKTGLHSGTLNSMLDSETEKTILDSGKLNSMSDSETQKVILDSGTQKTILDSGKLNSMSDSETQKVILDLGTQKIELESGNLNLILDSDSGRQKSMLNSEGRNIKWDAKTRTPTINTGNWKVPDKSALRSGSVQSDLVVINSVTKEEQNLKPSLGNFDRCQNHLCLENSSSCQCLDNCSTSAAGCIQHHVSTSLYHQKLIQPNQHSTPRGILGETISSSREKSTFDPISLICGSGSVSSKYTTSSLTSLRAGLFVFLLLSNCLVSSALRYDPETLRGVRMIRGSVLDTSHSSHSSILNISPYSGSNSPSTNKIQNPANFLDSRGGSDNSGVLHTANSSPSVVPTSQDNVQSSFYRSSMLYASDGSSSSDPNSNNSSGTILNSPTGRPLRDPDSCEVSNIKCALRTGCGMALQKYMLDCADLISGHTDGCDSHCRDSLLILTSTSEGRALMDCECTNDYCRATKARLEVCRAQVLSASAQGGTLSCRLAHLVCTADTVCATAIAYYDKFCRRMFTGRSCSSRCNNSIAILQRQQQASRLETCHCDGTEPFACADIKNNMARLCFHQVEDTDDREKQEEETNEIDTSPVGTRPPPPQSGAVGVTASDDVINRLLVTSLLVLVLQAALYRGGR